MRSFIVFAAFMLAVAGAIGHMFDKGGASSSSKPAPVLAAVTPQQPVSNGRRSVTIARDSRGHFQVEGRVDGRRLNFMVDTGASVIALTAGDARRLGINPSRNDFTVQVRTANGTVAAAPVTLNSVDIDGLMVRNVQALVVPGNALSENLLGLSYLTKLKRFEYAGGKMLLEQ